MTLTEVRSTIKATEGPVVRFISDLLGYGLASGVALACDYGLLVGLTLSGVHYLLASLVSFSVGLFVAYALCVKYIFASRRAVSREVEAAGFLAVGVAGLLLTQLLLYVLVSRIGLTVTLAKVPTTGLVFMFNFLCRRGLVFVGREAH